MDLFSTPTGWPQLLIYGIQYGTVFTSSRAEWQETIETTPLPPEIDAGQRLVYK
jgi:hypothetical protein